MILSRGKAVLPRTSEQSECKRPFPGMVHVVRSRNISGWSASVIIEKGRKIEPIW